jgi:DNA-binding LacI/PurR family transcriptional regulator
MALGALRVLREQGIAVPEKVGLIGLTASVRVRIPHRRSLGGARFPDRGRRTVDRLLAMIAENPGEKRRVPVRLLPRGSSRR